jgi:hypothetical protein
MCARTLAVVPALALGVSPAALGADASSPGQPSAIERLVRQEDARQADLARSDATVDRTEWSARLDARERSMIVRSDTAAWLDPAIRTAIAARVAELSPVPAVIASAPVAREFAWGAALLGVGAGIAAMCVLLGCVTLVRSHGRLRSV